MRIESTLIYPIRRRGFARGEQLFDMDAGGSCEVRGPIK